MTNNPEPSEARPPAAGRPSGVTIPMPDDSADGRPAPAGSIAALVRQPGAPRPGGRERTRPPTGNPVDHLVLTDDEIPLVDLRTVITPRSVRRSPLQWWLDLAIGTRALVVPAAIVVAALVIAAVGGVLDRGTADALDQATTIPSTAAVAVPPVIAPSQDPEPPPAAEVPVIDPGRMLLTPDGIAAMRFGDPGPRVREVLIAGLGEPDLESGAILSTGQYGTCAGDVIQTIHWGALTVVTHAEPGSGVVFSGYRVDSRSRDAIGLAAELHTAEGLYVGISVAMLEGLYSEPWSAELSTDAAGGPIYEVVVQGSTKAWGPLTSLEPEGVVLGIFSPTECSS